MNPLFLKNFSLLFFQAFHQKNIREKPHTEQTCAGYTISTEATVTPTVPTAWKVRTAGVFVATSVLDDTFVYV
jgi:hypothetical protein